MLVQALFSRTWPTKKYRKRLRNVLLI